MAGVSLVRVSKRYGHLLAVDRVSLEIAPAEFFVILGPAGAGKTSILKMIAGIEEISEGEIRIDGDRVDVREARDIDAAMIFENYALYPHRTVFENMAFPLKARRRKSASVDIAGRVAEIARRLEIGGLLERYPAELSGGQKQRVALGRALVRKPRVFLMDEPLSHLDAKLRHQMRRELKKLKQSLGTSVIFVTHDYLEALSLADRIAVLNTGRIVQVGTPEEVYFSPENTFVASLFGHPRINLVEGRILNQGERLVFSSEDGALVFPVPLGLKSRLENQKPDKVTAGIRPTAVRIVKDAPTGAARVEKVLTEPSGNKCLQHVQVGRASLSVVGETAVPSGGRDGLFVDVAAEKVLYFDPLGNRIKES
jgi:multiple sugar transport system ATP-binding protein